MFFFFLLVYIDSDSRPQTAKVTEKGGLVLTKVEDGKYTAEVEYEQKLTLMSELEGHDKIEKEVTIGAEDKTEDLKMVKSKVCISQITHLFTLPNSYLIVVYLNCDCGPQNSKGYRKGRIGTYQG